MICYANNRKSLADSCINYILRIHLIIINIIRTSITITMYV